MSIRKPWARIKLAILILVSLLFSPITPGRAYQENTDLIHVPGTVGTLQEAIGLINDGGIIELAAGTYHAPQDGFRILNNQKSFTIRAATGADVSLSGEGGRPVLLLLNKSLGSGSITFQGITIRDGFSSRDGVAGGMTVRFARVVFQDCAFINNAGRQPGTGGGGIIVAEYSQVEFNNCTFEGNAATHYGGGMAVNVGAQVSVVNSTFRNNRTNDPGHSETAAGGGIHVGNSTLRVTGSHFEGNQAGYVGGAIYAIGTWEGDVTRPRTVVFVSDSTFINNRAARDPSASSNLHTEGGAIHSEDQTWTMIAGSTFTTNQANIGGAVNLYRAKVNISGSLFQGNQANGVGSGNGFGGAIAATSNDGADGSTDGGRINRPAAELSIRDSYIQGSYDGVTVQAQAAAGLEVAGDSYHMYGEGGVPRMGSLEENRARVNIDRVIFADLDVSRRQIPNSGEYYSGTGIGGAMIMDLAELNLRDSLVIQSDALGWDDKGGSLGGGVMLLRQSLGLLENATLAENSAGLAGGGLFVQGSEIRLSNSRLLFNDVRPGVEEEKYISFGAAIFTSPDTGRGLPVNGTISNNLISDNRGLPVADQDQHNLANDTQYLNNNFSPSTYGSEVYFNHLSGFQDTSGLNNLVIDRTATWDTDKGSGNQTLQKAPSVGALVVIPSVRTQWNAGDPVFIGYAWSGRSATLNGKALSAHSGVIEVSPAEEHVLEVDGQRVIIKVPNLNLGIFLPLVKS